MNINKYFSVLFIMVIMTGSVFANCSDAMLECADSKVIKALQSDLKKQGFYKGKITGKYNDITRNSVMVFSKKKDITYDGYLNKELVNALWGVDINYENASTEDRINFLKKIKILKSAP